MIFDYFLDECDDGIDENFEHRCPHQTERVTINDKGDLNSCSVERINITNLQNFIFSKSYRGKSPVIITHSIPWYLETSWFDPLTYSETPLSQNCCVLIAKDNKNFLKFDKCFEIQLSISNAFGRIMNCSPETEDIYDDISNTKSYIRLYLNQFPQLIPKIEYNFLYDLMHNPSQSHEHESICVHPKNIGIWISSQGCETPLHFDLCHGFLFQISGIKRFLLCGPIDTNCIYWNRSAEIKNACSSSVDLSKWLHGDMLETSTYPLISEIGWFIAVLRPGDVLYTPPGWWHHVLSETSCVSILVPFDPNSLDILPNNVLQV